MSLVSRGLGNDALLVSGGLGQKTSVAVDTIHASIVCISTVTASIIGTANIACEVLCTSTVMGQLVGNDVVQPIKQQWVFFANPTPIRLLPRETAINVSCAIECTSSASIAMVAVASVCASIACESSTSISMMAVATISATSQSESAAIVALSIDGQISDDEFLAFFLMAA